LLNANATALPSDVLARLSGCWPFAACFPMC